MSKTSNAPETPDEEPTAAPDGVSRRRLLITASASAAAGALAGIGGTAAALRRTTQAGEAAHSDTVDLAASVPFYDQAHPAGIQTPPQRYAVFMTFDLSKTATANDLRVLLARWTAAIGQLVAGKPIGTVDPSRPDAVGADSGEAEGLAPASLTVTVGLGPGVFTDRFGLREKRPALLRQLPALPGEHLDPALTGGDLSLQACADDPQVAYHAVRNLARMVTTTAQTRWVAMGFGRASAGKGQQTPRNLMGFRDGTRNVSTPEQFDEHVWLTDAGAMTGGSYQVVRKIKMDIENWDADRVSDQEQIFARTKDEGAPLTGTKEFDTPDFAKTDDSGTKIIDPRAHIALAAHENNGGLMILRRSYNYTDGLNAQGLLDAGLLFIAYMNDPQHFVTLQTKLGAMDLLNEYIEHIGSAIFVVPPAPASGGYIGQALFE
ncbi:deferrochelatase/peroxidase EfeB [Propionibacterium cyclohexanicum]|uniref:Deferrochelatase/peroxidase EfeB n=1 Tax=Propionibacterium cyclohexanicum TaxID=64702 RepID=A0A1H9RQH3_9ACTN|nr:Dyp-type peroxidase [Propionibacterium cyclohexanicum]SER74808.1 deferrochelatase/peroxidase EfeB [Propionibacterium cyclohexanicum]